MGTRGAFGFRLNGQDKVAYSHYDSYPEHLGKVVAEFIAQTGDAELRAAAEGITLVKTAGRPLLSGPLRPSRADQAYYRSIADTSVDTGRLDNWYVLLRRAQGDPWAYTRGITELEEYSTKKGFYTTPLDQPVIVRHMEDSSAFLADSLFCEWAYLINLDDGVLEVYRGFNKDAGAPGRYAAKQEPGYNAENGYHGVALVLTLPLGTVRALTAEAVVARILAAGAPEEEVA